MTLHHPEVYCLYISLVVFRLEHLSGLQFQVKLNPS